MSTFTLSKHVRATPARTFEVFSDLRSAVGRVSGIKKLEVLTEGPIGVGTRFRETRIMFGREATEEMEVVALDLGRSYTLGCRSCGVEWRCTFRFSPVGEGTRVELEMNFRAMTLMAKLMSPLSMLFAGSMKKSVDQDLEDLRKAAEAA